MNRILKTKAVPAPSLREDGRCGAITIQYRRISFLPFYSTVTGQFPQNWGELTSDQLIAITGLFNNQIAEISFLKTFFGLKKSVIKCLSEFEKYKLMEMLEFIGDRKPYHEFIIKRIKLRWLSLSKPGLTLSSPEGKLKGITFGQFIFADTYFANYQESQNEADLNKFIASLYLGKNEKFDERLIQERFESIGKLDLNIRQSIVLNYQLIHEWLALAYPLIFQKREEMINEGPVPEREAVEGKHDPNVWIKVFQNFVGDDIIHDDIWAAKPVNTIFSYMTRKYKENARRGPT